MFRMDTTWDSPGNVILKIFWVTKKIHFKESI